MSVWKDLDSLFAYVYRSDHLQVMAQRRQWFEKPSGAFMAPWWLPAGTLPSVEEGLERIPLLDRAGPTPQAFNFKQPFAATGRPVVRAAPPPAPMPRACTGRTSFPIPPPTH